MRRRRRRRRKKCNCNICTLSSSVGDEKREQCEEGKNETLLSGASIRIVWVQFSLSEKTDKQEALQQQQHNAFQTKKIIL
jgi:hypothetical protein